MISNFILYIALSLLHFQQDQFPVTWHITAENTGQNTFEVQFEAYIDKGWVIYGMESPQDGPIATSFTFNPEKDIRLEGNTAEITKAESKFEPLFDTEVLKFSKKAVFAQKVTQLGSSKVVKGNITYMACDGAKCLPPTDVPFMALLK